MFWTPFFCSSHKSTQKVQVGFLTHRWLWPFGGPVSGFTPWRSHPEPHHVHVLTDSALSTFSSAGDHSTPWPARPQIQKQQSPKPVLMAVGIPDGSGHVLPGKSWAPLSLLCEKLKRLRKLTSFRDFSGLRIVFLSVVWVCGTSKSHKEPWAAPGEQDGWRSWEYHERFFPCQKS